MLLMVPSLFICHLESATHLLLHPLSRGAHSCTCVNTYKYSDKDKIEYEHSYGSIEAFDISTTDAFAEEDAVVIIIVDTHVTVIAVVHVICHLNVALVAIIGSHIPACLLVVSHEFLWPIALCGLVGALQLLSLLISQCSCCICVSCSLFVLFLCFWTLLLVATCQISILLILHLTVVKIRLWLDARVPKYASEEKEKIHGY